MIAKHIAMRSAKRSSFAGLATYITSAHGRNERVGAVRFTNVGADDVEGAVIEAGLTQAQNTRATGDKTYHIVVSFRPGEWPTEAALRAAEDALCNGLGFEGHQRISAVHYDTDNTHIHIAINKVHPTRHTLTEPYLAYHRIGGICAQVERDHGLEVDNHQAHKTMGENRADDMAEASGIEPLRDWIRRTCLHELRAATSWTAVHAVAAANGLTIEGRGAGLVITNGDGVAVKPSTVARELSSGALEQRLGKFERAARGQGVVAPVRKYEKRPTPTRADTTALFARYKRENDAARTVRTEALREARARRDAAIEDAKRRGRFQRAAIKLATRDGRRLSYGLSSRQLRSSIETARSRFEHEREAIGRGARPQTWADWLQSQAQRGHTEALAALRARLKKAQPSMEGVSIASATAIGADAAGGARVDTVTKAGTIIFTSRDAAVRDDGARLSLSRGAGMAAIAAALRVARARYGDVLQIDGSAQFRARVAAVAAATAPEVRFRDAQLEQQRAAFARQWTEIGHGRAGPTGRGAGTGRTGGNGGDGRGAGGRATDIRDRARTGRPPVRRIGIAAASTAGKPSPGRISSGPPPGYENRLRTVSQLDVVRIRSGGEMFLPRDAQRELEHPRPERTDSVRRPVPGLAAAIGAADSYIAERNGRRTTMTDIREHMRYAGVTDRLIFAGVRTIEGQRLALLAREDTILVKPIDDAEAAALPKQLGKAVQIEGGRVVPTRVRKLAR